MALVALLTLVRASTGGSLNGTGVPHRWRASPVACLTGGVSYCSSTMQDLMQARWLGNLFLDLVQRPGGSTSHAALDTL